MSDGGSIVAIGAYRNDENGINSGHVRVFQFKNNAWNQVGEDIDGEAGEDQSGVSVSMSDDGLTVAIGALGNDENGNNSGHFEFFNL